MSMTEIRKCAGCGVQLQNERPGEAGYVPDLEMNYCQRCFRLIHYDRQTATGQKPLTDIDELKKLDTRFIWLIDISDLETSLHSQFVRLFRQKRPLVILTKDDVLPRTLTDRKITEYVAGRLRKLNIRWLDIIIRRDSPEVREKISSWIASEDMPVTVTGIANAGKSTFINWLLQQDLLTVNPHPSTTLAFNRLETEFGTVIDSVGLVAGESLQSHVKDEDLRLVVPEKLLKPKVYQLHDDQTISLGGLARIDITGCMDVTAVVYCSDRIPCHRSAARNGDRLWQRHLGEELVPAINEDFSEMKPTVFTAGKEKRDICICGLGWLAVSGEYEKITVWCDPQIAIYDRKAMI